LNVAQQLEDAFSLRQVHGRYTGFPDDAGDVVYGDAFAGHDVYAIGGLFYQLFQHGDTLFGIWGLAGGQQGMKAHADDLFQGSKGIPALIEGAVKDKGKHVFGIGSIQGIRLAGGHVDHFSKGWQIRITRGREGSNDHTFDSGFPAQAYASAHFIHFGL
jgi:hypothetical protein